MGLQCHDPLVPTWDCWDPLGIYHNHRFKCNLPKQTLPYFILFCFARALLCLCVALLFNFFNSTFDNRVIFFSNMSPTRRAFSSFIVVGLRRNFLDWKGEYTLEQGGKYSLLEWRKLYPSSWQDNIVPYTHCHLAKDKKAQLVHHSQYIHLNLSWMGIIHTTHLVNMVGMNGIDPKGRSHLDVALMGACN